MSENSNKEFQLIEKAINFSTGVDLKDNKDRVLYKVDARKLFCYIARHNTTASLKEIGSYIDRDHSTVLYSVKMAKDYLIVDESFKTKHQFAIQKLKELKKNIRNGKTNKKQR